MSFEFRQIMEGFLFERSSDVHYYNRTPFGVVFLVIAETKDKVCVRKRFYQNLIYRLSFVFINVVIFKEPSQFENLDLAKLKRKNLSLYDKDTYFTLACGYTTCVLIGEEESAKNIRTWMHHYKDSFVDTLYFCMSTYNDYDVDTIMFNILFRMNKFSDNIIIREKSVFVVDLDQTLIGRNYELLFHIKDIADIFKKIKAKFDYIVLWTRGCRKHLQNFLRKYGDYLHFDYTITIDETPSINFKPISLLLKRLNKERGIENFTRSCLMDDQISNFNYDYKYFIQMPKENDNCTKNKLNDYVVFALDAIDENEMTDLRNKRGLRISYCAKQ